jgi:hypothetical protein
MDKDTFKTRLDIIVRDINRLIEDCGEEDVVSTFFFGVIDERKEDGGAEAQCAMSYHVQEEADITMASEFLIASYTSTHEEIIDNMKQDEHDDGIDDILDKLGISKN